MPTDLFRIVGTTVVGAFHVESVVAEGGFAVVYRAHHEGFRAPVALKCLKIPPHLPPAARERFADQFRGEAELLFKLSATIPAVVRPLHVEAVIAPNGTFMPFLALEWLEGETLEGLAEKRRASGAPIEFAELVTLLTPVARALERAHAFPSEGRRIAIVHRDLKPENIFLARVDGETVVKILDFGISAVMDIAHSGVPVSQNGGQGAFTPAFAAPEQWAPQRFGETGPWTDVWGLALTMTEVLLGRTVFDGDRRTLAAVMTRADTPRTPGALGVRVAPAVEKVFQKALALAPRERFRTAGEFWDALTAAAEGPRPSRNVRSMSEFDAADEPRLAIELGDEPAPPPPKTTHQAAPAPAPAPDAAKPLVVTPDPPKTVPPRAPLHPLLIPALLLIGGVLAGVANWVSAATTAEPMSVGPVPVSWISAALALAGLAGLAVGAQRLLSGSGPNPK